jgi:tetratricopeptide (TPR) repeat protein
LNAEELAALRGNKKRGLWAAAACLVFAVGGASYAATRGYLDPLIVKVSDMMAQGAAPEQVGVANAAGETPKAEGTETAKADAPNPDAPIAEGVKPDQPKADAPEPDAPTIVEGPKAAQAPPETKAADAPLVDAQAKAGLTTPPVMTDAATPADAKPTGTPSKALQACYAKGNRYLNAKKISLAIRELNKCLDIDPTYGRTYRSLGVAYMQLGRERSAILAYEKFVDYDPQHKDVAKVREIIADYYRRRKN